MYPAALDEQPIPDTIHILSFSSPNSSIATVIDLIKIPCPHPGHHM